MICWLEAEQWCCLVPGALGTKSCFGYSLVPLSLMALEFLLVTDVANL